jgi:acyl carrier protein
MNVKVRTREFLAENFFASEAESISDRDSLVMTGIIDSTGVLELVLFLEESFGIQVADADLLPENLDSLEAIEAFVSRKVGVGG